MNAPIESGRPLQPPPRESATAHVPTWARMLGLAMSLLPNIALFVVMPKFEALFVDFGAALPALTRLCIAAPWAGLAWTGIVACDGWRPRQRDDTVGFLLRAALGSVVLFGVVAFAMYLPIFHLAETI